MKIKNFLINLGAFAFVFIAASKAFEYFEKNRNSSNT